MEVETIEPAKPAKSKRMHHLDWLRAMLIAAAVYLHVNQIFGVAWPPSEIRLDNVFYEDFAPTRQEYTLLNQQDPDWRNEDYSYRFIMVGRQFAIPMLFWISGYSLCLSKEKATSSMKKVALITVVGMLANTAIMLIGPRDDRCNWYESQYGDLAENCTAKGLLIPYGIGTGSGIAFTILFQFWFTLFAVVFLIQLHPLVEGLRELHKRTEGGEWAGIGPVMGWFAASFAISSVFYLGFILGLNSTPEIDRTVPAIQLTLAELPYLGALMCATVCPAHYPKTARLLQYFAAMMALFQFYLPELRLSGAFDGGLIIFFHVFKHYYSLGFVMALKRKQSEPVFSHYLGPLFITILLVVCASTTNYYLAGVATYPYFPYVGDRVLWGLGCFSQVFCHDRVGLWAAERGSLMPLPRGCAMGSLMAYIFHVPLIAVFGFLGPYGGAVVTAPILIFFWVVGFFMEGGKKK